MPQRMVPATVMTAQRVDHRADDLLLEAAGLLAEVGEALENLVEDAADLAGAHHVGVELVERLRVLGERLAEGHAAFDVVGHGDERVLQHAGLELALEDLEAADDGQSGVLQRRELAREERELLVAHAADGEGLLAFSARAGLQAAPADLGLDAGREELLRADLLDRLFLGYGLDLVLDRLALRVHGLESKDRHGWPPSSPFEVAPRGYEGRVLYTSARIVSRTTSSMVVSPS